MNARRHRHTFKRVFLIMASASLFPLFAYATDSGGTQAPTGSSPSSYVGSDTCRTCHEDLYKSAETSVHFQTSLKEAHGCETCHGSGAAHVDGGGDASKIVRFAKLSRQDANARCLTCHGQSQAQAHFSASAHNSGDVGCIDCHSPHRGKREQYLLVKSQPELCFGCHTSTKAEFGRPYRHRVNEGLIECSDCHHVHGSETLRQTKALPNGDAICFKCHADKQGPFVFEHLPVKTEGCGSCHTPHGSTNPRLLRVNQINLLCLQCHTVPAVSPSGPAHNLSQKYQACTLCHPMIHGSNASQVFMK